MQVQMVIRGNGSFMALGLAVSGCSDRVRNTRVTASWGMLPVDAGHVLIVPNWNVADWFSAI